MIKYLCGRKRALAMKWACKSTAARYDDFKMMKSEIGKLKNENKLRKIKEPKNNEAMALLEKEKLCRDISRHGTLQLFFEQGDEEGSNQITFDNEKQITLKYYNCCKHLILLAKIWREKDFQFSKKKKGKTSQFLN